MFSGVHLSVIVNDSNKVAPVTDLSRVRLGQEIQNVSEINFFERRLWEMHGKPQRAIKISEQPFLNV